MCYAGATAEIWSELFPSGDWSAYDSNCWDEEALTARALHRVRGQEFEEVARGHWRKGDLHFVDPLDAPLLSSHYDMPRGMIRLGDNWKPGGNHGPRPDAIDFIPPRWYTHDMPWWTIDAVKEYYPELSEWLDGYTLVLHSTLGSAQW
jgi:hypothetical protein